MELKRINELNWSEECIEIKEDETFDSFIVDIDKVIDFLNSQKENGNNLMLISAFGHDLDVIDISVYAAKISLESDESYDKRLKSEIEQKEAIDRYDRITYERLKKKFEEY